MYAYASTGLTDQWDSRQYLARVNHDFVQFAWLHNRIAVHFGFDRIIPKCFFRVHQGLVYGGSHGNSGDSCNRFLFCRDSSNYLD